MNFEKSGGRGFWEEKFKKIGTVYAIFIRPDRVGFFFPLLKFSTP